jgi:threonine/homoserine/homoserine lactone efflux protein
LGIDWFLSLSLFIAIAGLTPGPNNIIAMGIGFNHNFSKVIPHLFGVIIGFPVMLLLIGLVLKPVMHRHEELFLALRYLSVAYVVYLAYHIAIAPTDSSLSEDLQAKPINFWQSLAFQWINPKAWAGAMTTITVYMEPEHYHADLLIAVALSMLSILVAISMWTLIGRQFNQWLSHPHQVRAFNILMAILLLMAVGMMVV